MSSKKYQDCKTLNLACKITSTTANKRYSLYYKTSILKLVIRNLNKCEQRTKKEKDFDLPVTEAIPPKFRGVRFGDTKLITGKYAVREYRLEFGQHVTKYETEFAHVPADNENYWKEKESRIITNEHDITTVTRRKSTLTRHHASVRPCVRASSASAAADVADSAAAAPAAAAAAAAAAATCAAAFRLTTLFRSTAATMRAHLAPLIKRQRFYQNVVSLRLFSIPCSISINRIFTL
ncbi:hypothetical protein V1477_009246 [Vespula maculifrons]|uniref:Uncharacterized protein n=1 Tax=Vespula maculifrons TaxID=7453 RepID=A0ABD2CCW2_VESMC